MPYYHTLIRDIVCIKVKQDDMKGSKQLSVMAHDYNQSTQEAEQEGLKFEVSLAFRVGVLFTSPLQKKSKKPHYNNHNLIENIT